MITREGKILRLVEDDDVAYHAGKSKMPDDGREDVNRFSIGIELISSHPDDDPAVRENPSAAYTPSQYSSLETLLKYLCGKFRIKKIVGHDEIDPGRKKDPGPLFEWSRIREEDDTSPLPKYVQGQ